MICHFYGYRRHQAKKLVALLSVSGLCLLNNFAAGTALGVSFEEPMEEPVEDTAQPDYSHCAPMMLSSPDAGSGTALIEGKLKFRDAWPISTGANVKVAVIDTGVAHHPRLGPLSDGGDVLDGKGTHYDCEGHGTTVAGLIAALPDDDNVAGVAPNSYIHAIRQTSADGGTLFGLAQAINAAIDAEVDVINISLTSCSPPDIAPPGAAEVFSAVNRAEQSDILIVAAAGNSSEQCQPGSIAWPAAIPEVMAVSAVDYEEDGTYKPADYAVTGEWVDIAAPGGPVIGLNARFADTDDSLSEIADVKGSAQLQPIIGTSFAAPLVTGTVALLLELRPNLSPTQIRQLLQRSATPISPTLGIGTGIVNPVAAVSWAAGDKQGDGQIVSDYAALVDNSLAGPAAKSKEKTGASRRAAAFSLLVIGAFLLFLIGYLGRGNPSAGCNADARLSSGPSRSAENARHGTSSRLS